MRSKWVLKNSSTVSVSHRSIAKTYKLNIVLVQAMN